MSPCARFRVSAVVGALALLRGCQLGGSWWHRAVLYGDMSLFLPVLCWPDLRWRLSLIVVPVSAGLIRVCCCR